MKYISTKQFLFWEYKGKIEVSKRFYFPGENYDTKS